MFFYGVGWGEIEKACIILPMYKIAARNLFDKWNCSCSSNIRTVVEKENQGETAVQDDLLCTACEMLVSWVQTQLKQKGTKETVLNYVNQVNHL